MDFLLKLLGSRVEEAGRVTKTSLAFHGAVNPLVVILSAVAAAALVYWMYRSPSEGISKARRHVLAVLRVAFLGLVLLLLLRPVLAFTVEGSVRRTLVLLFDGSASMKIKDPRITEADLKRAGIASGLIDPAKGLGQSLSPSAAKEVQQVARVDLLQTVFRNEKLDLLPRLQRDFDLSPFTFGQTVQELGPSRPDETNARPAPPPASSRKARFGWVDRLGAEVPQTAIGDAVRDVLNRKRGQHLAGIFIATDGANNSGGSPREVAALARQEGVPLYVYGVGITSPRDIIVGNLFAQEVSFVKDEVPVTVRVRSQGMAGQSARIALKLGGQKVDEKEIRFGGDGEMVVAMKFTPQEIGDFKLEAAIDPRSDETIKDNNSRLQHLRVVDTRIKVLLVEQSPRWEFRYLQAMLLRDRRVDLKCVLFEGDPGISRGTNSPYLDTFPTSKTELFKYDVIIFGDVDPKYMPGTQWENLGDFVARFGGALVSIAGKRFNPSGYRQTVLEKMLPVEFESGGMETAGEGTADKPIQPELTTAGRASSMLRLSDRDDESQVRWKSLPPVYWVARVSRAKPAAEVLLVDPNPIKETRFGKMPVMAGQQYGLGQVLYVGTDNTWRWRKNAGDGHYTTFWGQVVQRMSLHRLLGGSKRTQLSTDRQNYVTGERVTLFARLYTAGIEPITEPTVKGIYTSRTAPAGAKETEVSLRPIPEQPGVYRGEFVAPAPGAYKFFVDHDRQTQLDFNVAEPRYELGETAMNEVLLKEMAAASSGAFLREEDLRQFPELLYQKTDRVQSPLEIELWSSPFYFLLLLGLVTAEWILRKLCQLK